MIEPFPIRALHDVVIVEVENPQYDGLVALPGIKTEPPCIGTVMSVGSGMRCKCKVRVPFDVQVGDRIVYNRYGFKSEIRVGGKLYFALKREEIIAVYPTESKPQPPPWKTEDKYGALNE